LHCAANAWRHEVCNPAVGLFPDPVVDRLPGLLSLGEIDRAWFSSIALKSRFQERFLEMEAGLPPQAIGHIQLIALALGLPR
jgi:hypothetical protein